NRGYLHAQWRRSNPLPYKGVHTIIDGIRGSYRRLFWHPFARRPFAKLTPGYQPSAYTYVVTSHGNAYSCLT
ncbi:MAG TPA: hypothetical protein VF207_04445, partial [Chthoniobacterales bacterium]